MASSKSEPLDDLELSGRSGIAGLTVPVFAESAARASLKIELKTSSPQLVSGCSLGAEPAAFPPMLSSVANNFSDTES